MSGSLYSGTTSGRRAGVVLVTIDGEAVDVASDLVYDPTTVKRDTLAGQSSIQGYSEMPKAGKISMTLRDAQNFSVAALMSKTSSSVVAILASGKTVTGDGMWVTSVEEVNTTDGTLKVTFEGTSVVES